MARASDVLAAEVRPLHPVATGPLLVVAAALGALLVSTSARYGPHRDELYFVSAGARPAWGYPDQPPLTPMLAGLADALAPGSLVALRASSVVAVMGVVLVAGLSARELGGRVAAQALAAVTTGSGVLVLVLGHLLSTSTLDLLVWSLVAWLALRALLRDDPRWWLAAGAVAGAGLLNKHLVAFLVLGLGVGVLLTGAVRRHLRSPWLWAGLVTVAVLWAPTLAWQAAAGWPQLELAADIREEYAVVGERVGFLALTLVLLSPLATAVWALGLVGVAREPRWERARPLAWAFGVLALLFAATGGKAYYLGGLLPALVAAGCVTLEQRWSDRRLFVAGTVLVAVGAVGWPAALPLLPARAFAGSPYAAIGEDQLETIGWPELVAAVGDAVDAAGPGAVVFTGNYGEAGAGEWYGVGAPVYSGHNGFGDWGPPPEGSGPVVVLGYRDPSTDFTGCSPAGRVRNSAGAANEEEGGTVWVCEGPIGGWAAAWPRLRHLDA